MEVIRELPSLFDDLRTVPHLAGLAASSCGNGPLSKSSASQLQPKTVLKKHGKEKKHENNLTELHIQSRRSHLGSSHTAYQYTVYSMYIASRAAGQFSPQDPRSLKLQSYFKNKNYKGSKLGEQGDLFLHLEMLSSSVFQEIKSGFNLEAWRESQASKNTSGKMYENVLKT